MKVLAFTPLYLPSLGGIEIIVGSLLDVFKDHGLGTAVVTDSGSPAQQREILNGVAVYRLPFAGAVRGGRPQEPLQLLRRLQQVIAEEEPSLVHMHAVTGSSAWYLDRLLKARKLSVPFIVSQHGELAPMDRVNVVRHLLERADAITGVSRAALESAIAFAPSAKAHGVIPNGLRDVTVPAVRPQSAPYRLVCVGRLEPEKGFDLAIEALSRVRSRGLDVDLAVVGRGPERLALEALAGKLAVASSVHFLGAVDNDRAREVIAASDLLLAPSRTREGFSLAVVEAALASVPSVVARVGGLPETVADGVTGIVVPPDHGAGFAEAVERLVQDHALRGALGQNARRRALESYGLERCAERYMALYNEVLGSAPPRRR